MVGLSDDARLTALSTQWYKASHMDDYESLGYLSSVPFLFYYLIVILDSKSAADLNSELNSLDRKLSTSGWKREGTLK